MMHHEFLRSIQQNKAYWGVWLKEIAEHTGHSENFLHHHFKILFIPSLENLVTGEIGEQTTRLLSTQEFSTYLERIRAFAAKEWGMYLTEI